MSLLKCPVCNHVLTKKEKTFSCDLNHSYDISKYGYTNLLLANQIHSASPGDSAEMIKARVRFLNLNYYHILRQKLVDTLKKYSLHMEENLNFCDLACGEGYYTNYIHQNLQNDKKVISYGVDLSKQAIIEACKKQRREHLTNIHYVIGNLMNLPFLNDSFHLMLNCFAPMFNGEFIRILKEDGIYIRVLPGENHLYELKKVLYEHVEKNILKETSIDGFELLELIKVDDIITLKTNQEILDLFMMTPYFYKSPKETSQMLCSMNALTTQISFNILVYKKIRKDN